MLTVELSDQAQSVEIYFDDHGLQTLQRALDRLRGRAGHDHLMTPGWAGNELTETVQGSGNRLVNHLVLIGAKSPVGR